MRTIIILCCVLFGTAHATPGRVDSLGCHHSKKYGTHCHVKEREKRIQAQKQARESSATVRKKSLKAGSSN